MKHNRPTIIDIDGMTIAGVIFEIQMASRKGMRDLAKFFCVPILRAKRIKDYGRSENSISPEHSIEAVIKKESYTGISMT